MQVENNLFLRWFPDLQLENEKEAGNLCSVQRAHLRVDQLIQNRTGRKFLHTARDKLYPNLKATGTSMLELKL